MLLIKYPVYGNYLYDYPIKSIFVSSILAILVWFVSVGIVAKEIRTIDMNKELRAIN
jgi:uncharacterized membrane protein YagU involved in acid resistance